jgi:hypothetical protein
MSSDDLVIILEYRSSDRSAIQNWSGPGWYVHAAQEHIWAIEPRRIHPADARKLGDAFGQRVGVLVHNQQQIGRQQLLDQVARLEAVEAQLVTARDELAKFDSVAVPVVGVKG